MGLLTRLKYKKMMRDMKRDKKTGEPWKSYLRKYGKYPAPLTENEEIEHQNMLYRRENVKQEWLERLEKCEREKDYKGRAEILIKGLPPDPLSPEEQERYEKFLERSSANLNLVAYLGLEKIRIQQCYTCKRILNYYPDEGVMRCYEGCTKLEVGSPEELLKQVSKV